MGVLIIGAGLVGSQIARIESESNRDVTIFDVAPRIEAMADILDVTKVKVVKGDVTNPFDLLNATKGQSLDFVYHTAAYPMLTVGGTRNPYGTILLNVVGLANVLEFARVRDIGRLVFTSSGVLSSYVKPPKEDEANDYYREYSFPRPTTIYASTKLAGENLGLNYADSYGIDFVAVRFAAVYGPWRYGGGGGPTNLMKQMVEKSIQGETVKMPSLRIEFVYSKDAASGAVLACHADNIADRIFNIGSDELHDSNEIAEMLREVIPTAKIEVLVDEVQVKQVVPGIKRSGTLNLTRSAQQIGYSPKYKMKDALRDYVTWYRKILTPV